MNGDPLIRDPKSAAARSGDDVARGIERLSLRRVFAGLGVFGAAIVLAIGWALFAPAQMPPPGWAPGGAGGGGSGTVSSGTATQVAKYTAETTVGSQSTATFQANGQLYVQGSAANDAMIFGNSSAANGSGVWGRNSADGGQGLVGEATHTGAFPFTVRAPGGQTAALTRWLVNGSPVATLSAAGVGDFAGVSVGGVSYGSPSIYPSAPVAWATAIATTCDATVAGKIVPVTGALVDWIECSNASGSYEWLMRINGRRWQIPTLSAWTQTSASSPATTTTQRNGAIEMAHPGDTGTDGEWEFYHRTQPATPYSFTAFFRHLGASGNVGSDHAYAGVGFRESADDDYAMGTISSNIGSSGNWIYRSTFLTSKTSSFSTYADGPNITYTAVVDGPVEPSIEGARGFYVCVTNDGTTTRTVNISLTGITFTQLDTQTFNTDLTPDQIVFGNNSDNAGDQTTFFVGFAIRTGSTTCGAF